ncbi:MAG TPA: endonuclease/exonuclease/phosphatase family protein [Polyangiales bacterium]|nr:endonuclease/exonuclease/phosphatase family protein [Polyangiales bacterium]
MRQSGVLLLRNIASYSLFGLLVVGTAGQLVRDRSLLLMLAMFVPLAPVALVALLWDILLLGHAVRVRWLLSAVAVGCGVIGASWLWSPALTPELGGEHAHLRVVQWNTMWGGRSTAAFLHILDRLDAEQPDIVCLSEAPDTERLTRGIRKRHADWSVVTASNHGGGSYWYNLAVVSRYPVQLTGVEKLARGRLAWFDVAHPTRVVRIALVDLLSSPLSPRSPSIEQAAKLVEARAKSGEPIDLVLGDFNTPGRFLGFEALERAAGGYRRAALWSGEWRATWPSFSPLGIFDIDHVWISSRLQIRDASFFTTLSTDHRGARVDLGLQ